MTKSVLITGANGDIGRVAAGFAGAAYAAHIENTKKFDALASTVDDVARKLIEIADDPSPARCYVIGKDARLISTLQRLLPVGIMDRLLGASRKVK